MIDLQKLDWKEFESLVGLLLSREGHEIVQGPPQPGARGPDYETISPAGTAVLVETRHLKQSSFTGQLLNQFAEDIQRYRQQKPDASGLLVISASINAGRWSEFSGRHPNIELWHGGTIEKLLTKHGDVAVLFEAPIAARVKIHDLFQTSRGGRSKAALLTEKLQAVLPGHDNWKQYESVCTEILTYVFSPALATPDIQSRSDDGLDIIDAIFAIRAPQAPWSLVRSEYRTRFVVAEFKNYSDPIGQNQVESLAQYLWRPSQRFFGLLVSRQEPSASAIAQRRRKWLEEEKCIIFLSDADLSEMLQLRQIDAQPFDVIDAQLEEFFRTLTP